MNWAQRHKQISEFVPTALLNAATGSHPPAILVDAGQEDPWWIILIKIYSHEASKIFISYERYILTEATGFYQNICFWNTTTSEKNKL